MLIALIALPAHGERASRSEALSLRVAVNTSANQKGRLTTVGNGQVRRFHEYDVLGRPTRTEHVLDGVSYVFATSYGYPVNPAGTAGLGTVQRALTLPDGEVISYGYDASGAQQSITATRPGFPPQTIVGARLHNGRGQLVETSFGNGAVTTRTFNDATDLRLNRTRTSLGAATIQDYQYGFDASGNVTAVVDGLAPAFSATYGYDSLDQLTSMAGSTTATYQYDRVGNLTGLEGVTQTYGGSGRGPHALAASGTTTYAYDFNGNVASTSAGLQLSWNVENMATRAVDNGAEVNRKSFLGQELWKKVENGSTSYFLPGLLIENGQPRKYYGSFAERSPDGSLKFYHPDHLGGSAVVTDQFAAVVRRAAYLPYGRDRGTPAGSFEPRFQFNGQLRDRTGFYDYGARLYNPGTGRWLSPDSLTVDGLNRYAYVRNNPVSLRDPSGQAGTWAFRDTDKGWEWRYFSGSVPKGWTPHKVGEYGSVIRLTSGAEVILFRDGKHETVPKQTSQGGGSGRGDTASYPASALGGTVQALTFSPFRLLLQWATGTGQPSYMEIPDRAAAVNPKTAFVANVLTGLVTGKLVIGGGGSGPTTQLFGLREGRPVYLIGRYPDNLVKRLPGERVLDISEWTPGKNDQWMREIIKEGAHVNTATPINPETLWHAQRFGPSTFARELDQLLDAGYRLRLTGETGTLIPPR